MFAGWGILEGVGYLRERVDVSLLLVFFSPVGRFCYVIGFVILAQSWEVFTAFLTWSSRYSFDFPVTGTEFCAL